MLSITDIVKTFEGAGVGRSKPRVVAVDHVNVEVKQAQLYTLLGPSGCGKTTTLRSIAGLEKPDSGRIVVGGRVLFDARRGIDVPTHRRGLGMVFQSYAIWPHLNVSQNAAFPLTGWHRFRRMPRREVAKRVERVLELLGLEEMKDRPATKLSGGQQQRLALARALIVEPPVLLLDEPLSNLDAKLRERTRFEFKRMQRELNITAVYVTHDQTEALAMSDVIAVMKDGRVEQFGTPREIYDHPRTPFVADFVGANNFFDGVVESQEPDDLYVIATQHGKAKASSTVPVALGDKVTFSIRPEHVTLEAGPASTTNEPNVWSGVVSTRGFLGEAMEYQIQLGGETARARCNVSLAVPSGSEVTVRLPADCCWILANPA